MFEDEDPGWDRWEDALAPMLADGWDDDPGFGDEHFGHRGFGDEEPVGGWVDREPGALGTLTTIVLVGTHVVDTVRRPVRGSAYEFAALELRQSIPYRQAPVAPGWSGRSLHPAPPEVPREVAVLEWLATVVGGAGALDALAAEPLADEPLDTSDVRVDLRPRVESLSAQVDAVIEPLLGSQARTAARRLFAAAVGADPGLLLRSDRDDIMVGGIVYAVAKANDLIGGHGITASALQAACGLRSSPRDRAVAVARAVRGPVWALPPRPYASGLPDVLVLGSADLLVSAFRSALLEVRDRARAHRDATG